MQIDYRQAAEIIKACDNVHILTHQSPDGDTMGSGFALYFALRKMNKKAAVILPDGMNARYEFLSEGYEEPESFEPDSVIAVDIADPNLLGDLKDVYADRVDLCIDHHVSNIMYAKNTLLNGKASAACEVLFCLFEELGLELDNRIAKCLYTGIATDTGCFKFSNSSREAHEIAGKLIGGYDFDFARINREMFDIKSRARIKLEQHLLGNMNMYAGDRIAVISVTEELRSTIGVPDEEFDGVAGLPLQIQGVEVAVTIKEKKPGEYKVSMRSAGKVNVSAVCQTFGGGGHVCASGCLVKASLEEAEKQLVAAVEKAMGE